MLTIRLTRKGKKNQPFFKIVVIDKRRSSKGGRAVEELGYINPLTKKNSLEKERVLHWLKVGAKASPRVHNLLVSEKIIEAPKINVFKKAKKAAADAVAKPAPASTESSGEAKEAPVTAGAAETPVVEAPTVEASASDKSPAGQAGETKPEEKPAA